MTATPADRLINPTPMNSAKTRHRTGLVIP